MSIVFVRHGETALNAARVLQPADTPLNALGMAQAHSVARRLARLGPAGIVSSDLPRAWATAQVIGDACGRAVTALPLLHERNFGELRGRPYDTLGFDPLTSACAPPGGESIQAFMDRVACAYEAILRMRAAGHGPLVVVSHGMVIRMLLERHCALPAGTELPHRLGNTCVSMVSARPPHTVQLLGCTRHLDDADADDAQSLSGG